MRHYRSLDGVRLHNVWLTIGSFDGVHLGHQEVVRNVVAGAHQAGALAVVLTFYPHPAAVLRKRQDPFYLTTPDERASLLGDLGVDVVITHPFNLEVAAMSARQFMTYLQAHLGLKRLYVGFNFALGRGREGDVPMLTRLGEELGYTVHVVPAVVVEGEVVSSSQIRAYLAEGDVERVARLLGRPYQIQGKVVRGDGRGKNLGFPTANLSVWAERALPKAGVYVCRAQVNGRVWGAVTNVGVRPTFENEPVPPRVETHLLDFEDEIYGEEIYLEFLTHLRDEARFPSPEALAAQIKTDVAKARQILS
jgi:riboflavin kinase/FMN adenylyltransferase